MSETLNPSDMRNIKELEHLDWWNGMERLRMAQPTDARTVYKLALRLSRTSRLIPERNMNFHYRHTYLNQCLSDIWYSAFQCQNSLLYWGNYQAYRKAGQTPFVNEPNIRAFWNYLGVCQDYMDYEDERKVAEEADRQDIKRQLEAAETCQREGHIWLETPYHVTYCERCHTHQRLVEQQSAPARVRTAQDVQRDIDFWQRQSSATNATLSKLMEELSAKG